ncbi:MAG: glycosyltransferase family 39 protein [Elusimicrobiota bacterium]|nr:MAG: glycosyltransferase family 39 protein [Elusimicrobiota bacterium]
MKTKAAAFLLAAAAGLRFLFLGAKSLWFDEASTVLLATRPLSELPGLLIANEANPPLYYGLMHFWLKLFADPRLGLRAFSALCGAAALYAFKGLAERALPPRARTPALLLAALSSFWIHAAQDGRCYSLLLLISVVTTRLTLELSEKPEKRLWLAYAALAAAGLWTHYYYAVLLAGHAAWLLRGRDRKAFLLAHLAAGLAFAPWLPSMLAQARLHAGDPVLGEALGPARVLDLLGTSFFDVTFLGLVLPAWSGVAVGAGFVALLALARREKAEAFAFAASHLAVGLGVVIAVELWGGRPVTQARYFYPLSPLILLGAAAGLAGTSRLSKAARVAAGLVVLGGTAGYFYSALKVDPRLAELAAFIRRSSGPEIPVVHLGKYYYLPLRVYYLPERKNLLLASEAVGMDFRAMPPYPGVIEKDELAAIPRVVVVDESRVLSKERVVLATGAQLSGLLFR